MICSALAWPGTLSAWVDAALLAWALWVSAAALVLMLRLLQQNLRLEDTLEQRYGLERKLLAEIVRAEELELELAQCIARTREA